MKYERRCPLCDKKLLYSTKYTLKSAEKKNSVCVSCRNIGRKLSDASILKMRDSQKKLWTDDYRKKFSDNMKQVMKSKSIRKKISNFAKTRTGNKNPFYGSHHTLESKKLIGGSVHDYSGENNPMYGKPSPQGSGNGWSGWYKGWFFRSLRELSYMINVIERFNMKWQSLEKKKFAIPYIDWEGVNKNYFPDFLIEDKYVVEIKPKKLWNSPVILAKRKSAEIWCEDRGYKYKIVEPVLLTFNEIKKLHDNNDIKFLKKYEDKFARYNNK